MGFNAVVASWNSCKIKYAVIFGLDSGGNVIAGDKSEVVVLTEDAKKLAQAMGHNGTFRQLAVDGIMVDGRYLRILETGRKWFPAKFEKEIIRDSCVIAGSKIKQPSPRQIGFAQLWWFAYHSRDIIKDPAALKAIKTFLNDQVGTYFRPKEFAPVHEKRTAV